jgi:hypothetical protein
MTKTLNTDAISRDLEGSAFFPSRRAAPSSSAAPPVSSLPGISTPVPPSPVPDGVPRTPVPPTKRVMRQRQPFDIWQDQYETLKRIADDERARGLPGSMSRMIRDAIDAYLKGHTND